MWLIQIKRAENIPYKIEHKVVLFETNHIRQVLVLISLPIFHLAINKLYTTESVLSFPFAISPLTHPVQGKNAAPLRHVAVLCTRWEHNFCTFKIIFQIVYK